MAEPEHAEPDGDVELATGAPLAAVPAASSAKRELGDSDAEGMVALVEGMLLDMQDVAEALANTQDILESQGPASTARELKQKYQEATE